VELVVVVLVVAAIAYYVRQDRLLQRIVDLEEQVRTSARVFERRVTGPARRRPA